MRITTVRRVWQTAFLCFFLYLAFHTAAGAGRLGALGVSAGLFLECDPLIALGTLLAAGDIYHLGVMGLLWALVVLWSALIFGRAFCAWVCPLGTLQHACGWMLAPRDIQARAARNAHRPSSALKYVLLAALLGAAWGGLLDVGLLDPLCILNRALALGVLPVVEGVVRWAAPGGWVYPAAVPVHRMAWFMGGALIAMLLAVAVRPRFFCRVLCPLGALLGVVSRVSLFRIARDTRLCTGCGLCRAQCEGASEPNGRLRRTECVVCANCIGACPEGALSYRFLPSEADEVSWPDVRARRIVLAAVAGVVAAPLVRLGGRDEREWSPLLIRPPGAVEEREFLRRCVKCGQCMRVCPTNVLQPAFMEAGIAGVWTPVLSMRFGACDSDCTLCGQVCPTGAIERLTAAQRRGEEPMPGAEEPVRVSLGTAFIDRGRCLPWAMQRPCAVCESVCPVSPKAIVADEVVLAHADGTRTLLRQPRVAPELCIGCGACEHACPVRDLAAIRVSASGESRSRGWGLRDRGLVM